MKNGQDNSLSFTAYDQYMRQVTWIPLLTSEEETQLLWCLACGVDVQQAHDRLVEGCQYMVIGLAKRFVRDCHHMELLDFIQEGNIGLLRAIGKYDASKATSSFKTLAFAWVRGHMLMAYWQYERAISIPLHKIRAIRQMKDISTRLLALLGREPTVAELAREMEVRERDIQELLVLQEQQLVSLHQPLEDGDTFVEDVLEDPAASAFVDDGFSSVDDVLDKLTERERVVFQLRYGLVDSREYTQKEVAELLGVALSTVQMVDRRARMRLRRVLVA